MAIALRRHATDLVLPLCLAAMDACWVFLVAWTFNVTVLTIANFQMPSPFVLGVLGFGGWWFASYLIDRTSLPNTAVQMLSGVVGAAVATAAMALTAPWRGELFSGDWFAANAYGILVGIILWLMGGYRTASRVSYDSVYTSFRLGVIILTLTLLMATVFRIGELASFGSAVGLLPAWFFMWALSALAMSNREAVREEGSRTGLSSWVATLAASILAVLLLASIFGVFSGIDILSIFRQIVELILLLIAGTIYVAIFIAFWIARLIFPGIENPSMLPMYRPEPEEDEGLITSTSGPTDPTWLRAVPELHIAPFWIDLFMWVGSALVLLGVLWWAARGIKRTRQARTRQAVEERESLGSWDLLTQQLKAWLDRLMGRSKQAVPVKTAPEDDLAALQGQPEWSGTLTVRQIYARLQSLAARAGLPREPQQTPVEYLSTLSGAIPSHTSDFRDITAAYLQARYGPMPAAAPAVAAATTAWKRTEPTLQQRAVSRRQ